MQRNTRGLYLAVGLFTAAFFLFGWVVSQLLQGEGSAAVAQASPTNPPLPSIKVEIPTSTPLIELQPIRATIVSNGLEDTAQTTTAFLEGMHETVPQLADVFQHCTYSAVSFQAGETTIELTERGSVWVADDKADFRNIILTQDLNGDYKVALFIRNDMMYDPEYISNLNLDPGTYTLIASEDIEGEFTDEGAEILSAEPNQSFNEQLTMMICKSY